MYLLDSSTNKRKEINKNKISIYLCGPTVYNHIHIGNLRPIVTFDVLHRYLKFLKKEVIFIHNITDIDDKIVNGAKIEQIDELEFSNIYTQKYYEILEKTNILKMITPKVSENLNEMLNFIDELYKKGYAYKLDDGIYFDVSKFKDYGQVSNNDVNNLESNVRVENNKGKHNSNDFVLWKNKTEGKTWDSKFGKGRPGWHTECVVLINKYIKDTVTIHGGGIDLRFPHHENENAQFQALYNKPLANTWMHVGHLMIDNEKMSKSLGNFILVKDILDKWGSNSVRWFFYQTRYQKPLNYNLENMESSQNLIDKIFYELNKAKSYLLLNSKLDEKEYLDDEKIKHFDDDLNFPNIISSIQKDTKSISNLIREKKWDELNKVRNQVVTTLNILGIIYKDEFNEKIIQTLKEWNKYVINKDFESADKLRKILLEKKII